VYTLSYRGFQMGIPKLSRTIAGGWKGVKGMAHKSARWRAHLISATLLLSAFAIIATRCSQDRLGASASLKGAKRYSPKAPAACGSY
jgi:hypothetical protein